MHTILIKSDSRYPLDRKKIRERLISELKIHKITRPVEISVNVVGSRKMHSLNKQYRQIDSPTNVLSFPLEDSGEISEGFVYPQNKKLYLGDIVICYPIARQQSAEYQMYVDQWICDLCAHSLRHLLGIHHR